MEHNLIQSYIKELNQALKDSSLSNTDQEISKLIELEAKFARKLRTVAGGKQIYKDFINYILIERDLREARPFFRERENMYKDTINKAIKERKPEILHKMKVNYLFCAFAVERLQKKDAKLMSIYNEIKALRESLIHKHLHYALNRAKSFNRGMSGAIDFGDLIQIANEALIVAVDKYVPDEQASAFHTMALGRMISHLISSGDQSLAVSLGSGASRKLYQIKRLLEKTPGLSTKEVADIVGMIEEEVSLLMNVTSTKSLDESLNGEDSANDTPSITLLDFLPSVADENNDPYLIIEKRDLLVRAAEIFQTLTLLEQKALRLKGVNFKDYY